MKERKLILMNKSGITLIALVITIIVLLILAGVSINAIMGDEGLMSNARSAKENTRGGNVKEKVELVVKENQLNEYSDVDKKTRQEVIDELYADEQLTDEEVELLKTTDIITIGNIEIDFSLLNDDEDNSGEDVEIVDAELLIGDYVEYNVSYTDMYSDTDSETDDSQPYTFSATDGWRVIYTGEKQADGSYRGTKLISTGIPAKFGSSYVDPTNENNINSLWWGTVSQVNSEFSLSLDSWTSSNSVYFVAYGLRHNFELMPFSKTNGDNIGVYTEITNSETASTTTGAIFKTSKAEKVQCLKYADINGTDTGLYVLRDLETENSNYGYTSTSTPFYWIADAGNADSFAAQLKWVRYDGYVGRYGGSDYGIRPVITLNSDVYYDGTTWKIK